jgi:hypothetical protein
LILVPEACIPMCFVLCVSAPKRIRWDVALNYAMISVLRLYPALSLGHPLNVRSVVTHSAGSSLFHGRVTV